LKRYDTTAIRTKYFAKRKNDLSTVWIPTLRLGNVISPKYPTAKFVAGKTELKVF